MIEWAKVGREILDRSADLDPTERALMEAHLGIVEQTGQIVRTNGVENLSSVTIIVKDNSIDHLRKVTAEYRKDLYNPELVTAFQQAFWQIPRGERNYTFKVGECDWIREDMTRPLKGVEKVGRGFKDVERNGVMVALPDDFRGRHGLILVGRIWPELSHWSVQEDTSIADGYDATSYLKVEANTESPNRDTREQDYADLITPTVRGQRLITYIAASKQNREINGQDFDLNSWSRLPGSRRGGLVVDAGFFPSGRLRVHWSLASQYRSPHLGVRFEEVNRA